MADAAGVYHGGDLLERHDAARALPRLWLGRDRVRPGLRMPEHAGTLHASGWDDRSGEEGKQQFTVAGNPM